MLSKKSSHNTDAEWLINEEAQQSLITPDTWKDINTELFYSNLKKLNNWKSPGIDKVHNFWIKKLHALHIPMMNAFNFICKNPNAMPTWMTEGITSLIPKGDDESCAKNYRPITCLPTTYKFLTLILSDKIYKHISSPNDSNTPILQFEQKGCRRLARGCKDQLMIDKCITKIGKKKNISFSWIDYRKAYDSIPHSWIKKVLDLYKIDPITKKFISIAMQSWKTKLTLQHSSGTITSKIIPITSGIFQGDSLSPLLFCICLFPLTNMLNRTNIGVNISANSRKKINHLLYMDDIKLFANGQKNMSRLTHLLQTFSNDINMTLNINKCATITFNKGRILEDENALLPLLKANDSYKYLGLVESSNFLEKTIKKERKDEYFQRVRKILQAELNGVNTSQAITTFAVPVLRYSFGIVHWTDTELKNIDRKTRTILTKFKFHHPKSDVNNLYLSREKGG